MLIRLALAEFFPLLT